MPWMMFWIKILKKKIQRHARLIDLFSPGKSNIAKYEFNDVRANADFFPPIFLRLLQMCSSCIKDDPWLAH
jgi:hypothetical protein